MRGRPALGSALVYALGFAAIILSGKVVLPTFFNTTTVPNGLYLYGLIVGLLSALLAIGLVLIYRANRIINFAQGSLGAVAATLASQLFQVFNVPYIFSVLAGLVAAVLLSLLTEVLVIRRFSNAPRLILTVATIGVAQILSIIELLPNLVNKHHAQFRTSLKSAFPLHFDLGGVRFGGDHIVVLLVVPLILGGLAFFLRSTRYGVATRAAAENSERARLLGCRVKRVSAIVWGLAGALSAFTALLRAPILGFQLGALQGPGLIMRALAAAVLARMESLPATVAAAVLLTVGEQTVFFAFGNSGIADGFVFFVILVGLLLQRKRFARVDPAASSWRAVQEFRPVPRELAKVSEVRWAGWGARAAGVVVLVALPFVLSASRTNLASVILVFAMVGVSLVILTGWSGNVSLGQWAIAGVGGLMTARLATATSPPDFFIILIMAGVTGAVISLLIGLPALRIRGLFLGVTTLAFALAAQSWFFQMGFLQTSAAIQRPVIFGLFDVTSERAFYYVSLGGIVFALLVARNLRRSRIGRNLIAIRDNETHAQSLGMRLTVSKLGAFAVSGFIASMAGALYAYNQQAIRYDRFTADISLLMFSMVVIGGMGSLSGAILGAIYVRGIQYFLPAEFQLFATGFGLLILLLVFPGGLGQIFYSTRDRFLRWVAEKRDIAVPSLFADRLQAEPVFELAEGHALGDGEEEKQKARAKRTVLAETRSRG